MNAQQIKQEIKHLENTLQNLPQFSGERSFLEFQIASCKEDLKNLKNPHEVQKAQIEKEVAGMNVTAIYYKSETGTEFIKFESVKGNVLYAYETKHFAVCRREYPFPERFVSAFEDEIKSLIPVKEEVVQPEPKKEEVKKTKPAQEQPIFTVVDAQLYKEMTEWIECELRGLKGHGEYRYGTKNGQTLYAWVKKAYKNALAPDNTYNTRVYQLKCIIARIKCRDYIRPTHEQLDHGLDMWMMFKF